jgi:uncharacterized protein (DUF952 family)
VIYHWCPRSDWEAAGDAYLAASFGEDGFIHCSFEHQVSKTASALDRGRQGMVLLAIDETGLPLVVEDCYETGEGFPHVYGPIPVDSVVAVDPFSPGPDGSFRFPGP